ncbi:MAG: HlyD family efflux transporter periplasmic adaptor subunit [Acidobacteriota bacterium]
MSFPHTSRFLLLDNFKSWSWLTLLFSLLLALWGAWLFFAEVPLVEASESGRLEVSQRVHRIESPIEGKLLSVKVVLRQAVQEGDVLVSLNSEEEEEHLAEAQSKLQALLAREEAVQAELGIEEELAQRQSVANVEALKEARLKFRQESISSSFAALEVEKSEALQEAGLISEVDWLRLQGEAQRHQAMADSAEQGILTLEAEQRSSESESLKRQNQLEQELLKIREERIDLRFQLDHLQHTMEDRQLRTPVDGIVGSITELRSGAFLEVGDAVAEIVPDGEVTVSATFKPTALGRVRPGQPATLRLDAYPWPQHGTVPLVVDRLATEPDEGTIRVELSPTTLTSEGGSSNEESLPALPLEHGLTGSIEIEVDRLSPLQWLLRAAGGRRGHAASAPTQPASTDPA